MLTDVNDIGYRTINNVIRRNSKGEKVIDHEPIIERELFDLCFYPLAETDLDGNPIKEKKARRFMHRGNTPEFGLLKFRIASNQGEVFTHPCRGIPAYVIKKLESETSLRHYLYHAAIPCVELDEIIVDRLMQHAREITQNQEDIEEYEKQAHKKREERHRRLAQVEQSIRDIDKKQAGLTRSQGQVETEIEEAERAGDEAQKAIKERRKQLIIGEIETLEFERINLVKAVVELEEDSEGDLGSLNEEIKKLEAAWPQHTFEKRRSFINFLIKEVRIERVSPHWVWVQVWWLHEAWGREEMYYHRNVSGKHDWTEEEEAIAREHYAATPRNELMALLPERGWDTITEHCRTHGLRRRIVEGRADWPHKLAYADLEFMRSEGIPIEARHTNWERLY